MLYYLRSISEDGTYYLVNGWKKHKAYWTKEFKTNRNTFKSASSARCSYSKLCKIMPEYLMDEIHIGSYLTTVFVEV